LEAYGHPLAHNNVEEEKSRGVEEKLNWSPEAPRPDEAEEKVSWEASLPGKDIKEEEPEKSEEEGEGSRKTPAETPMDLTVRQGHKKAFSG
jgi:hypothetical protein